VAVADVQSLPIFGRFSCDAFLPLAPFVYCICGGGASGQAAAEESFNVGFSKHDHTLAIVDPATLRCGEDAGGR